MSCCPTLETERLILRAHRVDDFEPLAAMWADPIVVRYIGGTPSNDQASWARLLRYAGHWALLGFGFWALEEKASGRFAGELGFMNFERTIDPPIGKTPEGGWVLPPWAHGRGFATEGMKAAIAWLEARSGPSRMVCLINSENAASMHVARKCGFREWTRTTYEGHSAALFER